MIITYFIMESLSKFILLVTCFVVITVQTTTQMKYEDMEEVADGNSRIVNGREAKDGEFPWMVALHVHNNFRCSACLIAPTIVLTAAHCVRFRENGTQPVNTFFAIVGNVQRDGPETRIEFVEVIPHPEYADIGGSEADIALLRTKTPIPLNEKVQTICLPKENRKFEGKNVRAIGWGRTSTDANETSPVLRTTELKVMSHFLCKMFYALYNTTITDRHVCVNANRATGVCSGDSGSPLVYNDARSSQPITIGVASFIGYVALAYVALAYRGFSVH